MNAPRMKGKTVDVVFGVIPAFILLLFFGVLGAVWNVLIVLDALGKIRDGQLRNFDTSDLWSVLLAPLAWCGTATLAYTVAMDDQALSRIGKARRLLLSGVLALSIAAVILGIAGLFSYPDNRTNTIGWLIAACGASVSIIATRQIAKLASNKKRNPPREGFEA